MPFFPQSGEGALRGSSPERETKALHRADAAIDFQFGACDEFGFV